MPLLIFIHICHDRLGKSKLKWVRFMFPCQDDTENDWNSPLMHYRTHFSFIMVKSCNCLVIRQNTCLPVKQDVMGCLPFHRKRFYDHNWLFEAAADGDDRFKSKPPVSQKASFAHISPPLAPSVTSLPFHYFLFWLSQHQLQG